MGPPQSTRNPNEGPFPNSSLLCPGISDGQQQSKVLPRQFITVNLWALPFKKFNYPIVRIFELHHRGHLIRVDQVSDSIYN